MAFRDSWHRALVYFGLAEERDPYEDEDDRPTSPRPSSRSATASARTSAASAAAGAATTSTTSSPTTSRRRRDRRPPARRRAAATAAAATSACTSSSPSRSTTPSRSPTSSRTTIPVVLNLQGAETDLSKRLIDFASGLTYALDGGMQRIADKVFMLTPRNVEISAEERAQLIEKGFFNQS